MQADKVQRFMEVAAQSFARRFAVGSEDERKLGAQLLLSEVLEYVIQGLGVIPEVNGTKITEANEVKYLIEDTQPDKKEMLDGLADVAYTMYWNAVKFGMPLEEAYELVCDNNLSKFVPLLEDWEGGSGKVDQEFWDLGLGVRWPESVVTVEVVKVGDHSYGVGKDASGKVRKPSTYQSVDLEPLIARS